MKLVVAALALNVIIGAAAGRAGVSLVVAAPLPVMLLLWAIWLDQREHRIDRKPR